MAPEENLSDQHLKKLRTPDLDNDDVFKSTKQIFLGKGKSGDISQSNFNNKVLDAACTCRTGPVEQGRGGGGGGGGGGGRRGNAPTFCEASSFKAH